MENFLGMYGMKLLWVFVISLPFFINSLLKMLGDALFPLTVCHMSMG